MSPDAARKPEVSGLDGNLPGAGSALPGRLCRVADDLLVCRIEHLSTFAIPLRLIGTDLDLAAWALAISPHQGTEAIAYLLVLRAATGTSDGFRTGERFILSTHFRDLTVEILSADGLILSSHERAVLARSALTARLGDGEPGARAAGRLLSFVAPALDALMEAEQGEEAHLGLGLDGRTLTVTGDYLPQWIVVRTGDGYRRFAVEEAVLRFDEMRSVALTLEPAWTPDLLVDRAILVGRDDCRIGALRKRRAG